MEEHNCPNCNTPLDPKLLRRWISELFPLPKMAKLLPCSVCKRPLSARERLRPCPDCGKSNWKLNVKEGEK